MTGTNVGAMAELFLPTRDRGLRRLPRLLFGALRLVRMAAPRELRLSAALQILGGIAAAAQVLVIRQLLEGVQAVGRGEPVTQVVPALLGLALVSAVISFTLLARVEQQRVLGELVGRHAVDGVLEVSTAVDLVLFDDSTFHDRLQRAMINAATRPTQMVTGLLGVLSSLLGIAGIAAALLFIEPVLVPLVVFAYGPLWLVTMRASRVQYLFGVEQTERDRKRSYLSYVLTRRDEAAEVRAFGLSSFFRDRHRGLWDERIIELRRLVRQRLRLGFAGGLVTSLLTALSAAVLIAMVAADRLSLADAGAAAGALLLLGQRLQVLGGSAGALYESSLFIEDFTTFVDAMPVLQKRRATGRPPVSPQTIRVQRASFTYPTRDEPALREVDVTVARGQVVALVGENGSGKSTLAKLLAGLYAPDEGRVLWDDVDLTTCDPDLVRRSVAVVMQDFSQYALSAHDNIAVGSLDRFEDRQGVVSAAVRAEADAFLSHLPGGYDSVLGAEFYGGSDLSLGQWQRVAMARAYFRDAPFLILDEPSSSLDPRSEAALFQRIRELQKDRTVVVISHRFSTVRTADLIVVLHEGRVVEQGSHDDLMRLGGRYAELFTLQAASYQPLVDETAPRGEALPGSA